MIRLSNGHVFEYMAASGALAYDGEGWFWDRALHEAGCLDASQFLSVTPSLTLRERKGNLSWLAPWRCIRPLFEGHRVVGFVNAKGLTNPGVEWWLRNVEPMLQNPIVVSIYSHRIDELRTMVEMFTSEMIAAFEVNASCPNTDETFYQDSRNVVRAATALKRSTELPIVVKLSESHDLEFLGGALQGIAGAFDINAVAWNRVFPGAKSPFEHLGGGAVSGKIAQPWTWEAVRQLTEHSDIPVIGPSVWAYEDIGQLRDNGASAISFGSVFLRYPHRVTDWVRRDRRERFHRPRLP